MQQLLWKSVHWVEEKRPINGSFFIHEFQCESTFKYTCFIHVLHARLWEIGSSVCIILSLHVYVYASWENGKENKLVGYSPG